MQSAASMENSKKRWSVTYTKHIKRKVFQDGFLDLHTSTNKVNLFDDCDKLLESKILKADECIKSGETLTFNGFLVDVGDPEGVVEVDVKIHRRPVADSKFNEIGRKIAESPTPNFTRPHKFRSPVSAEDNKDSAEKSKTQLNNTSSSRKVIRDFKRSESLRYEALKSRPETIQTGVTEWHVLYTTQVTQKAKKYHDGFLRLKDGGPLGRQIMLYDESGNVLNTRFLKKDEIIRSDESIAFDGHLVDIGEPKKENQVPVDLNAEGNIINLVGKEERSHERQNLLDSKKFLVAKGGDTGSRGIAAADTAKKSMTMPQNETLREKWHVLYATHVTQKAKKYHEGFLRLKDNGALGRQIMLYDASRNLLSTRFLKKDEIVRSDESVAFGAHLVDIGEPEEENQVSVDLNAEGNILNTGSKEQRTHEHQNRLDAKKFRVAKGENAGSRGISAADTTKKCMTVPQNKPLRETHQILSILQKPIARGTAIPGCAEDNEVKHISSAEGLQVLNAKVEFQKDWLLPDESVQNDGPIKNKNIGDSLKGMSTLGGAQPTCGGRSENPDQDNTEGHPAIWSNEALASGFSSLEDVFIHGPTNDEMKISGGRKLEEWPSFDLGF